LLPSQPKSLRLHCSEPQDHFKALKNKKNKNPCSMLWSALTVFGGWWVEVVVLKMNFSVQL
jgi:hypothetical protein